MFFFQDILGKKQMHMLRVCEFSGSKNNIQCIRPACNGHFTLLVSALGAAVDYVSALGKNDRCY